MGTGKGDRDEDGDRDVDRDGDRPGLTLVADEEAHAGPAAVRGEEQAHGVAGADEELGGLRALVLPDQWGRAGRPVPHLQGVVVHLGLEPGDMDGRRESCANHVSLQICLSPAMS